MSSVTRSARKSLIWLLVLVCALGGLMAYGMASDDRAPTPGLALDLAGGTQVILKAVSTDGTEITPEVLAQAVEVIRRRVDGSGVAEAEITTQGAENIIVALPGTPAESTLDLVRQSAQLQFRPVIYMDLPNSTAVPEVVAPEADPVDGTASAYSWATEELRIAFGALDCTLPENLVGGDPGDPDAGVVMCQDDGSTKLLLGPVEISGADLANATSGPQIGQNGVIVPNSYQVNLEFKGDGTRAFADTTRRLVNLPGDRNHFAMVLDGVVISPPGVESPILNGQARISGSFTTPESASTLANALRYGSLPITLEEQSTQTIGATLGSEQLQEGLIAGLVGLILVALYSLLQYRALGFVTILSLVIAAAFTYLTIWALSWTVDYRLSLAGIAGLIIAIGVTADSFIVYFERVRDELREGRSLVSAVDHAWKRARRTILASDAVSFLAAAVLYTTAVGNVRGFAFTLGLTTVIDLVVVMLFTHPVLTLLARTRFFGQGHRLSGFDPRQLGKEAIYRGRGRVRTGPTLAERKAAAQKGDI